MPSHRLRALIPAPLKSALRELAYAAVLSDATSLARYFRVNHPRAGRLFGGSLPATTALRVRALGGQAVAVRTAGTDARVVFDTFHHQFHLPPAGLIQSDRAALVLDLGANLGLTMAHLAALYPRVRIVGVEMDADNAALARANVAPWGDRCEVVEAAVWTEDGTINYERRVGHEDGFSIARHDPAAETRTARAVSLDGLIQRLCPVPDETIDFVKMDIEGAERDVLRRNTGWTSRVRCIKVELHDGYSHAECVADLERLGFRASPDTVHDQCVLGIRHHAEPPTGSGSHRL
jgi:FkbM family methyltransferase